MSRPALARGLARLASLRWRHVRWVALAAVIPALWACNARRLDEPIPNTRAVEKNVFVQSLNRNLDILFMVDNSSSMKPMQTLLTTNLPAFMTVLENLPGGLPDLHVGVISSSAGAGIWADVQGCRYGQKFENDEGRFHNVGLNPPGCMGPTGGGKYLIASPAGNNFAGNISQAFSCIAAIGDTGCGFEHQFWSTWLALEKAANPADADNGGFLRTDAYLAVIMLTNEDDCSVPGNSMLLDPNQSRVSDPLGGLQTGYRCNEFGHVCDDPNNPGGPKVRPPHTVTANTTLTGCVSAEDQGQLIKVSDFVAFMRSLKPDPDNQIFVAALAGPVDQAQDYTVELRPGVMTNTGLEDQPAIRPSCGVRGTNSVFADPGVRINQWVEAFGERGVYEEICAGDFAAAMQRIAQELSRVLGPQCLTGNIANKPNGEPDCQVSLRKRTDNNMSVDEPLPMCDGARTVLPCWRIEQSMSCAREMQVCYDAPCAAAARPQEAVNAQVSCALVL